MLTLLPAGIACRQIYSLQTCRLRQLWYRVGVRASQRERAAPDFARLLIEVLPFATMPVIAVSRTLKVRFYSWKSWRDERVEA